MIARHAVPCTTPSRQRTSIDTFGSMNVHGHEGRAHVDASNAVGIVPNLTLFHALLY